MTSISGVGLAGYYSSTSRLASYSSWSQSNQGLARSLVSHRESRVGRYMTNGLLTSMAFGLVSVCSSMLLQRYMRRMTSNAISSERTLIERTSGKALDVDEVSDDESEE